jgi:hypothetical protein
MIANRQQFMQFARPITRGNVTHHPRTAHPTAWSAIVVATVNEPSRDILDILKRPVVEKLKVKVTKIPQKMLK